MKRVVSRLLSVLLAAAAASLSAGASADQTTDTQDCAQIENARDRLACFDRRFPHSSRPTLDQTSKRSQRPAPEPSPSQADADAGPAQAPATTSPLPPATEPARPTVSADTPVSPAAPAEAAPDDVPFHNSGGLFDKREPVNMQARIKKIRQRDKQKTVFLLENDQMWIQDSPRSLPIREGDMVTIKSATIGGYMLTSENGTTTRVRRIR